MRNKLVSSFIQLGYQGGGGRGGEGGGGEGGGLSTSASHFHFNRLG